MPQQDHLTARLVVDDDFEVAPVNNRLFGSFVEHLGRCVYTGIYEPDHPTADEHGFRKDVIDLVKELGATTIRYPGGNFVSGYRWEDGVGPKQERPRRLDLAWHSTETNEFGLHEMSEWLEATGGNELMEAVNLGTRGLQEALDLLEYANVPGGTELSERRRANGADKPFDIRMWCLGNEMDGPWQLGHKSAEDYGTLAASVAAGMRQIDPDVELVVCGSSAHGMPTFGKWEQTVLEKTYENVNFVSCHAYYQPFFKEDGTRDMASFLASGVDMDGFIKDVAATIDATKAHLKSAHDVYISFDEWNVWYQGEEPSKTPEGIGNWPVAPRLLEDIYTAADAVVFGDLMITLLKNADRVRAASLAQLVNVIAPIMTEPGGPAWRQTTFHPFSVTARLAKGGTVLEPKLSLVRRIRETDRELPILFSSARVSPKDVVKGYELGVDNYVKKPFLPEELDAHVRALLRMKQGNTEKVNNQTWTIGGYTLDPAQATLRHISGSSHLLTPRENGILELLFRKPGEIIRREIILDKFWNTEDDYFASRTLDVFIAKLRKLLEDDPLVLIKTIRGVGLMLVDK